MKTLRRSRIINIIQYCGMYPIVSHKSEDSSKIELNKIVAYRKTFINQYNDVSTIAFYYF